MGLEQEESRRVALSSRVLEVKYDLDRTGMKNRFKKCMHWSVPLDALPGSATIGPLA